MREIKFRAWDKEKKEMLYDSVEEWPEIADENHIRILHDGVIYADSPDMGYYGGGDWSYRGGTFEIMQYTGLKDSKDKDIFEGDIITAREKSNMAPFTGSIRFLNAQYFVYYSGYDSYYVPLMQLHDAKYKPIEVIGNIYQNPELLIS